MIFRGGSGPPVPPLDLRMDNILYKNSVDPDPVAFEEANRSGPKLSPMQYFIYFRNGIMARY